MVSLNGRTNYNEDDILTPKDIAGYLRISQPTAIKLIREGEITGGSIGNRYRALFKYVKEFEDKVLKGGLVQQSLSLIKKVVKKSKKAGKK